MKTLIAIDANSLMHRAYYALPSMTARDGTPTGAVYGFISMLLKLVERKPDYMLAAFDMHGPTFRHDQYDGYKAGRKPTPDDLRTQFPLIKQLIRELGITVCECERYEADDILGTFSHIANEAGVDALLVTGDRDALQLISEHTHVLMTKKGISDTIEYDEATLFEQYGLTPSQMPHLKGLMGDASDNLPGIPGVGEKTALKLLEKYKTLENTLENAENEKGALREKLLNSGESARMSFNLGVIDVNAPVHETLEDCRFEPENMANAAPLMNKLELRSLVARLPKGEKPKAAPVAGAKPVRVKNAEALAKMVAELGAADSIALAAGEMLWIASGVTSYEVSLEVTLLDEGLSADEVLLALKAIFENKAVAKAVFDAKSLMHMLAAQNISLAGDVFDVMIADYLLHAIHPADSFATLCRESGLAFSAAALFELKSSMKRELEHKGMTELFDDVEMPLVTVLFEMEQTGFALDKAALMELSEQFGTRLKQLENDIYTLANERFNILSTKQLGTILFEKLGLPPQKKTKSGYSTDAEVLEKLEEKHPIVPMILEYRFLAKLKSTFLDGLTALVDRSGRVHTRFNQTVTATGRISSAEPNLQNIPVRTDLGREIRKAFVASEGCVLVGADYSQIELRLLAHMSGDHAMTAAFNTDHDIHTMTAAEVFGVPVDEVTPEQRRAAKAVNFGIVYGISDFGLAKNASVSRHEAAEFIERYFARYPGVKAYMDANVEKGRQTGFVSTLMGRRRELPEIQSSNYNTRSFGERVAMNMPIQGTAADIIKLAMVRVRNRLLDAGLKAKLILQIHDELIIDAPFDEAEQAKAILEDCMENAAKLSVPLTADVHTGHSWFDTK